MSIRKGSTIIAGTGGSGNSDYLVNQNITSSIEKIYDWVGTLAEYEAQDVKHLHPDWVCFITNDSGQLDPNKKTMFTNRNVGDIFFTSRLDSKLNGAVPCDGAVYQINEYSDGSESIANLLLKNKLPYITTAEYEVALSQNGNVGVFGWDGLNAATFRVPTLDSIFIEAGQANRVGYYLAPGLPNITGEIHTNESSSLLRIADNSYEGAFAHTGNVTGTANLNITGSFEIPRGINFDASRSSSLYGASSTVQPKAVKYRAMVQLLVGLSDEAVDTCNDLREHAVRDTDLATLLQTIYPVGSVYIGTQATCPMATVIADSTWELVSSGKALWTGNGSNANTTIAAGLPDITGSITSRSIANTGNWCVKTSSGAFTDGGTSTGDVTAKYGDGGVDKKYNFKASSSNSIYGNSTTVQPPAYVVNVWRRTA